jgi:DNA-binding NarL/FixJ family response regulator
MASEIQQTGHSIKVALIEGDPFVREQLSSAISRSPGLCCVGLFEAIGEAILSMGDTSLNAPMPDVLLIDLSLAKPSAAQGIEELRHLHPPVQIVMLAAAANEEAILESFSQGACGFLLKKTPPEKVLEAIHEAWEGGSPMSPEISRLMVTLFQRLGPPDRYDL